MGWYKGKKLGGYSRRGESEGAEHRTRMPAKGEVVGLVAKAGGATNFLVRCNDGNERVCTIPVKYKRMFWIKMDDLVIVRPWVVQSDKKGDIVWRYSKMDSDVLKKSGLLEHI